MIRRAITKTAVIKVKIPRARIPGSHGERTLMLGMGSMYSLDQSVDQLLSKSLKPEGAEDNGVNSVF